MKSKLNRLVLVLVVVLVSLALTSLAFAQPSAWNLVVDTGSGAIDLSAEMEMTVSVSFSALSRLITSWCCARYNPGRSLL